jgi:hypothetical protein
MTRRKMLLLWALFLALLCAGCEHFAVELPYNGQCIHHHAPPPPWPIHSGCR